MSDVERTIEYVFVGEEVVQIETITSEDYVVKTIAGEIPEESEAEVATPEEYEVYQEQVAEAIVEQQEQAAVQDAADIVEIAEQRAAVVEAIAEATTLTPEQIDQVLT